MYLFFLYHSCSTAFYFPLLSTSSNPSLAYTPPFPSPSLPFSHFHSQFKILSVSFSPSSLFITLYPPLPSVPFLSILLHFSSSCSSSSSSSSTSSSSSSSSFSASPSSSHSSSSLSFSSFFSSSSHSLPQCLLLSPLGSNAPNRQITLCSCSYSVQH